MSGEDAVERAERDPAFLARFAQAYSGTEDPLTALRRFAEGRDRDGGASAASLYGPGIAEADRRRLAEGIEARRQERDRVSAAIRVAAAPVAGSPAAPTSPPPAPPQQPGHAPAGPGRLQAIGIGVLVLSLMAAAYAAGAARTPAPSSTDARKPTPTPLPTALYFDDRAGQAARVAWSADSGGPRSVAVRLPPMRRGWSVSTACLSRDARPLAVPVQTVLLLDDLNRQLGSWTVPCDAVEHRFVAIVWPARPPAVRLVLVLDDAEVRGSWASLDPTTPH